MLVYGKRREKVQKQCRSRIGFSSAERKLFTSYWLSDSDRVYFEFQMRVTVWAGFQFSCLAENLSLSRIWSNWTWIRHTVWRFCTFGLFYSQFSATLKKFVIWCSKLSHWNLLATFCRRLRLWMVFQNWKIIDFLCFYCFCLSRCGS